MQTAIGGTQVWRFSFPEIYNAVELFMNIYSSRFSKKEALAN